MGPHLAQCCQVASWSIQPFGHNTPKLQRYTKSFPQHRANRYFYNGRPKTVGAYCLKLKTYFFGKFQILHSSVTATTTVLRPSVQDYPGEPVPEETLTHKTHHPDHHPIFICFFPSMASTTIHSILPVQITCLAIFFAQPLSMSSLVYPTFWSGALHLIFHTFLHQISVFFSQHMPIRSQPVAVVSILYIYS